MNRLEHLMTIFNEECSEIIQDTSKALCFGLDDRENGTYPTNQECMRKEFNQLIAMAEMLEAEGVDLSPDHKVRRDKKENVERYLGVSKTLGTLSA